MVLEKQQLLEKLVKYLKDNDNKVIFAACDTFRAAAIEQA